jgi:hypothetical protein
MALAWMGVGSTKRSFSRARNSGSVRPRVENVFDGTKSMLRRPTTHDIAAKMGALVFAFPRDSGANASQRIFREGSPSGTGRNANHAITEYDIYMPWTKAEARRCREFQRFSMRTSRTCNV